MSHPQPAEDDEPLVAVTVGGGAATETSAPSTGEPRPEIEEEFSRFYPEYMVRLTRYLVSQGASLHTASDIAQDTMIKAFEKWPTIRSPRAWTHKVAYQAYIRHAVRVEERPVEEVPEPTVVLPRPDEAEAWVQQREIVRVLQELPPRQRQVLALTLDGWTPSDIAEMTGIDDSAVRSSLLKARRAAVRFMQTEEGE